MAQTKWNVSIDKALDWELHEGETLRQALTDAAIDDLYDVEQRRNAVCIGITVEEDDFVVACGLE